MSPACPSARRSYRADAINRRSFRPYLWMPLVVAGSLLAGCMERPPVSSAGPTLLATDVTGSLATETRHFSLEMIDPQDRSAAIEALAKALDPMADNQPTGWDEGSGTRGSFAARGRAFIFEDQICRGFNAMVVRAANQQILQGTACRQGLGEWRVIGGLNADL
jgi:surface antigen